MRIQHNIMAMNAYRNYNNNTSALSKNLEKLSSGYKINRAGDDAAGLAISEKMRAQITGLSAAQKNVKDGISLVKTAEGAMQEIQDMLNRMDYLATQSANGTYDDPVDRLNLQKEVNALKDEINRIADSANFNGIKLLDGSLEAGNSTAGATGTGEMVTVVESQLATGATGPASLKTNQDGDPATKGKYTASISAIADTTNGGANVAATDVLKFEVNYRDADGVERSKIIYSVKASAAGALKSENIATLVADGVNQDADLKNLFTVDARNTAGEKHMIDFEAKEAGTNGAQILGLNLIGFVDGTAANAGGTNVGMTNDAPGTGALSVPGAQKITITTAAKDMEKVDVIDFNDINNEAGKNITAGTTVTIGDKTYEFVDTNKDTFAVAKGNIAVNIGADGNESVSNLTEALKANGVTSAVFVAGAAAVVGPPAVPAKNAQIKIGNLDQIKAADNSVKIATSNKDGIKIENVVADKEKTQFIVGAGSGNKASLEITYIDDNGVEQKASIGYESDATAATNATNIKAEFEKHEALSNLFKISGTGTDVIIEAKNPGAGMGSILSVKTTDVNPDSVKGVRQIQAGRDAGQTITMDMDKMTDGDTLTIDGKTFQFVDKDNLDSVKDGNTAVILDKTSQVVTASNLNLALKQAGMDVQFNGSTNSFFIPKNTAVGGASGGLTLQIGDTSDKFNQLQVSIGDMHVKAMGKGKTTIDGKTVEVTKTVADIDISNLTGAQEAIAVVKNAINYVSGIRGDLGAIQNRLEHTQNNLSVMAENIQDAESTIRDTDVADEMMAYTKNNILIQSAQAMLAQANQVPQGVLQLLG